MKYVIYIALLYIFLPLCSYVDLIVILIFFLSFRENVYVALILSFFAGLLVDLYYPTILGINILIYIVLVQIILLLRRYIAQNILIVFALFSVFYLTKTIAIHLVFSAPLEAQWIVLTLVSFLPIYALLNKITHTAWIRT